MKLKKIALVVMSLLGTASALAAPVGSVLAIAGEVTAQRAGQELRLTRGAGLENGDVLQVGPASVVQLRFIDDSVVSLRANSTFKIENFRYTRNPAEDRSIFGLIKGGMRTITGLIGKSNPENYAVKGVTATIGIRGTHFTIVSCDTAAPCKNQDDTQAPEGIYGGVTDGRIAVSNEAGEFEFGQQEYFRVASQTTAPLRLLAPPSFLSSGFESEARGSGKRDETEAVAGTEGRGSRNSSPQTSNSPQLIALTPLLSALPEITDADYQPSENPVVISQAAGHKPVPDGAGLSPITAGDGRSPTAASGLTVIQSVSNPGNSAQHDVEYHVVDAVVWDNQGYKSASCGTGCYVDRNQARSAERGADGGVLEWGRWVGGPTAAGGWGQDLTFSETQGWHYVTGLATPASDMPTNGAAVSYALLGATAPTFGDGVGNGLGLGRVKSASATVNFVASTLAAEWAFGFAGGNEYRLLLPNATFSGSTVSGAGSMAQTAGSTNVCSGSSCSATFSGYFAGSHANYLALGYDVKTTATSLNGVSVFSAQATPVPEPAPAPAPATDLPLATLDFVRGPSSFALTSSGTPSVNELFVSQGATWSLNGSNYTDASNLASAMSAAGANVLNDGGLDGGYVAWDGANHVAFGPVFGSIPSSGTATYEPRLATVPSDSLGRQGKFTPVPIVLNFTNQTLSTSGAMQMVFPANASTGATSFQLSASNVAAGSFLSDGMLYAPMTVSCQGCSTTSASGHLQGALMADADLGLNLQTNGTVLSNGVATPLTGNVAAIYYSPELTTGGGAGAGIVHTEASASDITGTNVISEQFAMTMDQVLAAKSANGGYTSVLTPSGEHFYWAIQEPRSGTTGYHQAWGSVPTALPSSGTAVYSYYGGTTPMDNFGRVGSISSAAMTVNFTNQTMTANTATGINLTFPASGTLPVTMYQMAINNVPITSSVQQVPTTCVGCASSQVYGGANLSFAGTNGQAVLGALAVQGQVGASNPTTHVGAAAAIWAKPTP